MFGELEKQREELTATVHALRSFEATYRGNLTRHLQSQIDVLASGREEPADPPAALDEAPTSRQTPAAGAAPAGAEQATATDDDDAPDRRRRLHRHRQRHPAPGRAARRPALTHPTTARRARSGGPCALSGPGAQQILRRRRRPRVHRSLSCG